MNSTDFDGGWKEIIEEYFPEFLEFFFPEIFQDVDFTIPYEFLDKEFQEIVKDKEHYKLISFYRLDNRAPGRIGDKIQKDHNKGERKNAICYQP